MSGLCLQNALMVANGKYHEEGLKIDFMAVSALNDAMVESVGLYKDRIEGIPASALQQGLISLLSRHQHSEEFYGMIDQGRELILHTVRQDHRVLSDLKNWDTLSHDHRLLSANYFANLMRDIFVSHIELPPDTSIVVHSKRHDETPAIDYSSFGMLAPPAIEKDVGGRYPEILVVDTNDEKFQDGSTTYAALYMDYLRLIERTLPKGNMRGKFGHTLEAISRDVELCRTAEQHKAFINPLLKDVSLYHFSGMLTRMEGGAMVKDLDRAVETHGQDIPVYIKPTFRDKINLFLGGNGLHL